jgi:hypothetical protein
MHKAIMGAIGGLALGLAVAAGWYVASTKPAAGYAFYYDARPSFVYETIQACWVGQSLIIAFFNPTSSTPNPNPTSNPSVTDCHPVVRRP